MEALRIFRRWECPRNCGFPRSGHTRCGSHLTCPPPSTGLALDLPPARVATLERGAITEHANLMTDGSHCVRPSEAEVPGLERIYPLEQWIQGHQRHGGKVYRRKVVVVEDWVEVPRCG